MIEGETVAERMRSAFAADRESRPPGKTCPEPDRIWDALHESLEPGERCLVVDHIAECAACAADWRVAMRSESAGATVPARGARTRRRERRRRWPVLVAAAAALLVVVLAARDRLPFRDDSPTVYRAGEEIAIRSLLAEDEALPREGLLLRWTPLGQDARYSIEIDTPELRPLSAARGLVSPEYPVPAEALAGLPPGATIVWRVEARLPDGRRVASPAFLTRIE